MYGTKFGIFRIWIILSCLWIGGVFIVNTPDLLNPYVPPHGIFINASGDLSIYAAGTNGYAGLEQRVREGMFITFKYEELAPGFDIFAAPSDMELIKEKAPNEKEMLKNQLRKAFLDVKLQTQLLSLFVTAVIAFSAPTALIIVATYAFWIVRGFVPERSIDNLDARDLRFSELLGTVNRIVLFYGICFIPLLLLLPYPFRYESDLVRRIVGYGGYTGFLFLGAFFAVLAVQVTLQVFVLRPIGEMSLLKRVVISARTSLSVVAVLIFVSAGLVLVGKQFSG